MTTIDRPASPPMLLEARGAVVRYGSKRRPPTVHGADLEIRRGDSVAIVGESGSGKSTLAKAMVGLVPLAGGELVLDGRPLGRTRSREQIRSVQMVFQDPSSSLNPSMTVGRMLEELLRFHRLATRASAPGRVAELLELVGLPTTVAGSLPRRLSGGQRQRVGIARALAVEPQLLIADESTAALDVSVQAGILNLLARLRRDLGLTLVFISHDLAVVRYISDRVVVMRDGCILEDRPTEDLFSDPRDEYTRTLLSAAFPLTPSARG